MIGLMGEIYLFSTLPRPGMGFAVINTPTTAS